MDRRDCTEVQGLSLINRWYVRLKQALAVSRPAHGMLRRELENKVAARQLKSHQITTAVPELAALPEARQTEIWRECFRHSSPGPWFWCVFVPAWTVAIWLTNIAIFRITHHLFLRALLLGPWGAAFGAVYQHMRARRSIPEPRKRLGDPTSWCAPRSP